MWYLEPKWLRCLLWRLLTGYRFPCRKRTKKIHGTSITWGDHLRSNTLMRSNPSILHTGIWGVHRNGSLHSKWITAKINKRPCETHWPDVVPWAKMATVLKGPLIDWLSFRMRKTIQKKRMEGINTTPPRCQLMEFPGGHRVVDGNSWETPRSTNRYRRQPKTGRESKKMQKK